MHNRVNFNEIYIAIKEIDYVEARIYELCQMYNNRHGADYLQQRALFRSFCHNTINFFDECFDTTMLGMIRCKHKVQAYQSLDNIDLLYATMDIVDMLLNLKVLVKTMVPIKDLPSCKKLLDLSPEEIISKSKDLVKNDIVKAATGVLLLGSKINDVVKIEDVKNYYSGRLVQLRSEIFAKNEQVSPIEQFLLDKFNAEIGYCNVALLKTGIGITEELKGLADIGKKHIEKFVNHRDNNSGQLLPFVS